MQTQHHKIDYVKKKIKEKSNAHYQRDRPLDLHNKNNLLHCI
ncbi:hypothetical protein HMPREF1146_0222 [Prevotella sp. MSX73]|nr:hypothetical protein HMPREF1146_0222 [Prevotella sp. MSX73]